MEKLKVLHYLPGMYYGGTEFLCLTIAETSKFCKNHIYSSVIEPPTLDNNFAPFIRDAGIPLFFPDSCDYNELNKGYDIVHFYGGGYPPEGCAGVSNLVFNMVLPPVNHPVLCTSFSTLLSQIPENECYLFRCAINPQKFDVSLRKPHDKINLVRVARPTKSIHILDEVIANLLDKYSELGECFIIGDIGGVVHPKIHYLGRVPDVREYLSISDIFVYMTQQPNNFTCDIAVLEAMAMGVIPVCSNSWNVTEQIDHGETGILTDYNGDSMKMGIEYLIRNPQEIERMRINGCKRVLDLFDITTRMPLLEQVYRRALEMKKGIV